MTFGVLRCQVPAIGTAYRTRSHVDIRFFNRSLAVKKAMYVLGWCEAIYRKQPQLYTRLVLFLVRRQEL